ncbi:four helix bundle protein [Candidatus Peregrinibacteria bacterium]|nr:four helix bundle protein [Candidatus Peregrinibacteria bacterium]
MGYLPGSTRASGKDRKRFYGIAKGSLEELHYQCLLAADLEYITPETFAAFDAHIQRVSYLLFKIRQNT